jgi:PAS domain-containing protein
MRCGLLIVSDDGLHLCRGLSPSLPAYLQALHKAIDSVPVTPPYHGVCAQVVHQGSAVLIPDVANETRYAPAWRDLLLSFGHLACRSSPVLATFAMYYDHPGDPTPAEPHLIDIATHLAAIAIERDREQARMRQSRDQLAIELADVQWLQDISTEAAALLRERGARLSAMFDNAGVGMALMSSDFSIIHANARFCAITGRSRGELIGNGCLDFTHPDDIAANRELVT